MDDFERRFADVLADAVPEPPRQIDPAALRPLARPRYATAASRLRRAAGGPPRHRPRLAAAGAAALVIAAVVVGALLVDAARPHGVATRRTSTSLPAPRVVAPAALARSSWRVIEPDTGSGLIFTFRGSVVADNADDAAMTIVRVGSIDIRTWVNGAVGGHFPKAPVRIYTVLSGRLRWWIRGDVLTMTGVRGTVRFRRVSGSPARRSASPPPSTRTPTRTVHAAPPAEPAPPDTTPTGTAQGCNPPRAGRVVRFTLVVADTPAPPCARVRATQRVEVVNELYRLDDIPAHTVRIRAHGLPQVTLRPGKAVVLARPIGDYLSPGQHCVRFAGRASFDIWVV